MNNTTEFLNFVNASMGVHIQEKDLDLPLVDVEHWDSMNAIRLMSQLEKQLNFRLPIAQFLQANTLKQIFELTQKVTL